MTFLNIACSRLFSVEARKLEKNAFRNLELLLPLFEPYPCSDACRRDIVEEEKEKEEEAEKLLGIPGSRFCNPRNQNRVKPKVEMTPES
jgi:hypothetical protein